MEHGIPLIEMPEGYSMLDVQMAMSLAAIMRSRKLLVFFKYEDEDEEKDS
jgi:hypothetical protein